MNNLKTNNSKFRRLHKRARQLVRNHQSVRNVFGDDSQEAAMVEKMSAHSIKKFGDYIASKVLEQKGQMVDINFR